MASLWTPFLRTLIASVAFEPSVAQLLKPDTARSCATCHQEHGQRGYTVCLAVLG